MEGDVKRALSTALIQSCNVWSSGAANNQVRFGFSMPKQRPPRLVASRNTWKPFPDAVAVYMVPRHSEGRLCGTAARLRRMWDGLVCTTTYRMRWEVAQLCPGEVKVSPFPVFTKSSTLVQIPDRTPQEIIVKRLSKSEFWQKIIIEIGTTLELIWIPIEYYTFEIGSNGAKKCS